MYKSDSNPHWCKNNELVFLKKTILNFIIQITYLMLVFLYAYFWDYAFKKNLNEISKWTFCQWDFGFMPWNQMQKMFRAQKATICNSEMERPDFFSSVAELLRIMLQQWLPSLLPGRFTWITKGIHTMSRFHAYYRKKITFVHTNWGKVVYTFSPNSAMT